MTITDFYDYCLSKKGVTEHFPFDEDTLVFKVGGKMFALSSLSNWESGKAAVNLKCDPERAVALREEYSGVVPGFHMSKVHWNTVTINSDVPVKVLRELIDHSYELVFNSLTKKGREEILHKDN
ncbi:MmcQ/YjbR family DNA-binding protein [Flavobacterium subsaxonicum]|uniref:MmcQ-like protein n=1 Tax=Flavobacterium subsaxonicum WB 4.1-42 = DSM 21790 TaxID=1121898 RepID=A0A0A2MDY5_9FLAO|nr:MmcQ/YjbR family DNA-binding protein [Flavobacterium subsaxonicum]KGO90897.1 MmcQ-like protein [Flavobacterium subsaxonicum WB 4.1-42 = DSM 21790]